jgi:hypothetical protein
MAGWKAGSNGFLGLKMAVRLDQEKILEGQQFTKLGRKYQHDLMYLQSINTYKHLPLSLFTGQFF